MQDLIICMNDFDADPFDEYATAFCSLQSVVTESPKVLQDLWYASEEREKQSNYILEKRVFSK